MERRIGRFKIPRQVIIEDPEMAIEVLKGIIIFRAEMMFHLDCIEYIGISPNFDPIKEGEESPVYEVLVSVNENGENLISFERRNV